MFLSILGKMLVLSVMYDLKVYGDVSSLDNLSDNSWLFQTLAVGITVVLPATLLRPIYALHRHEKRLRRRQAILRLRDALLDPTEGETSLHDCTQQIVVSKMLLEDLRTAEAIKKWRDRGKFILPWEHPQVRVSLLPVWYQFVTNGIASFIPRFYFTGLLIKLTSLSHCN